MAQRSSRGERNSSRRLVQSTSSWSHQRDESPWLTPSWRRSPELRRTVLAHALDYLANLPTAFETAMPKSSTTTGHGGGGGRCARSNEHVTTSRMGIPNRLQAPRNAEAVVRSRAYFAMRSNNSTSLSGWPCGFVPFMVNVNVLPSREAVRVVDRTVPAGSLFKRSTVY